MMRKVTFGVASSLDNFIAREDGSVDWLQWNTGVSTITNAFWNTIDTVIMGRKTYEVALQNGTTSYSDVKNFVFSRTMKESPDPQVQIISENAAKFVSDLKRKEGKGICVMGGGELARSLFEASLIDEIGLNIHPILLGSGIPLFHKMTQTNLELIECKTLKNGCVYVLYHVRKAA
jgi:dihydrofolate reductase